MSLLSTITGRRDLPEGTPDPDTLFKDPVNSQIAVALWKGKTKTYLDLIPTSPNLDEVGKDKITLLEWALFMQRLKGFEALLDAGADPALETYPTPPGSDPLVFDLVDMDDPAYFEAVMERGFNPDFRSNRGATLLGRAARAGREAQFNALMSRGADVNMADANGSTPLNSAFSANKYHLGLALLEAGADPHAEVGPNHTPLHRFVNWDEDILTQEALEGRRKVRDWFAKHDIPLPEARIPAWKVKGK